MDIDCGCFSHSDLHKINFLTKTETPSSHVDDISSPTIDRVPDEVLIHIFSYIPPVNIDNYVTFIALEMVSKRFHRCVADNGKILENTTELVIGSHPHLPDDEYICHIGNATLLPYLRRVKKITKIVINVTDQWMCREMKESQYIKINLFGELELRELVLYELYAADHGHRSMYEYFVKSFIEDFRLLRFLESVEFSAKPSDLSSERKCEKCKTPNPGICVELAKYSKLKHLKLIFKEWEQLNQDAIFSEFLKELKYVQVLEINGYHSKMIDCMTDFDPQPLEALQTVRFKNPAVVSTNLHSTRTFACSVFSVLRYLRWFLDDYSPTINEVEIDICPHSETLSNLHKVLENVWHPIHLKMIFLPYLEPHKVRKIEKLLENAQDKNVDGMKISVTFMYSEYDQEEKLSIVHRLLDKFDVPHGVQQQVEWKFFRGKVCINLKMESIADESLICHPYHPHEEIE